jgi:DNA-binding CsgD family transcriptional regulator
VAGAGEAYMKTDLTPRQHEILQLVVLGFSDKQIACKVGLRRANSVSSHILRARDRLDCKSREELIAQAVARGLVSVPVIVVENKLNISNPVS